MFIDLSNKTALVTGSTSGIGQAIATGLHQSGASVVVTGRDQGRVDDAVKRIGADERVCGVAADIGTPEGCQTLIDAAPDIDILVNNLGIIDPKPVFDISDSDWERLFAVNVMSGVRLARHHVPRMVEREWGRVIFVSSESALNIPREMVHYGVTKLAQLGVSRGIAESVAATGVTINSVLPGPTHTEGSAGFLREVLGATDLEAAGQQLIESERPTSLIRRFARAEEVANLVVYVASELSSATTGAALRVDGGVVRDVA
jgi:NAD(P)-dependent dehydrogenase (short-subunit alcohol dehydrogenase family)